MFSIQPDIRGARRYLERLEKRDIPRVLGRTLKRTGDFIRTRFSQRLRARLALKKALVDAGITLRRSPDAQSLAAFTLGRTWVEVHVTGKPIPIRDFNARVTRRGVTYQVSRGRGRRLYVSAGQPGFMVASIGNHVFVRKGPDPPGPQSVGIRKAMGPALPHFLKSKREQRELIILAKDFFARDLERNIKFVLQQRADEKAKSVGS